MIMNWKTSTVNIFVSLLSIVECYHIEHNPGKAASYQNVEIKINPHEVVPASADSKYILDMRQPVVIPKTVNLIPKYVFQPHIKQSQGYAVYENQDEGQHPHKGVLSQFYPSQLNQGIFHRTPFTIANPAITNSGKIQDSSRILGNTNFQQLSFPQFHIFDV